MTPDDVLRFPIGAFSYPDVVSSQERQNAIQDIIELPAALRTAVRGLTDAQLDTPYRDGGWTVRQVVHHLVDSHMNAYIRTALALTEDNPTIKPYAEERWAELPHTRALSIEGSLVLLEALHARWGALLHSMDETAFARTYYHPESQRTFSLSLATAQYGWHSKHHTAHVTTLRARQGWE